MTLAPARAVRAPGAAQRANGLLLQGLGAGFRDRGLLGALERTQRRAEAAAVAGRVPGAAASPGTLRQFIRRVEPSFVFYRHVEVLIELLQLVVDGKIERLMVWMPPRHGKSELVSRLLPAYFLRCFPRYWAATSSYGAELAQGMSRRARGYYQADGGQLDMSSRAVNEWSTQQGGGSWATGVGGPATGRGYHLGIVDDPVKDAAQAQSPAYQRQARDWWDTVWSNRAEPGGRQIIVQTRWGNADLSGHVLKLEEEDPENWHVLDLAAIAVEPEARLPLPSTCTREPDWRQPGEPLCPERYPLGKLEKFRRRMPEQWWMSLFQQRPIVGDGTEFQKGWFRYYDRSRPIEGVLRTFLSIDCTFKDADTSDFVGITVWAQTPAGLFLLDLAKERLGFWATIGEIMRLHAKWKFRELVVEEAANGAAVIDTLKREGGPRGLIIHATRPAGGKVARARAAAPWYEHGWVFHPAGVPWLGLLEDQLLAFPNDDEDDLVDSTSQAILFVAGNGPMGVSRITHSRGAGANTPAPPDDAAHVAAPGGPLAKPIDKIEEDRSKAAKEAARRRLTI